jgi:hypothetical protein
MASFGLWIAILTKMAKKRAIVAANSLMFIIGAIPQVSASLPR